jgi:hypothetical protein
MISLHKQYSAMCCRILCLLLGHACGLAGWSLVKVIMAEFDMWLAIYITVSKLNAVLLDTALTTETLLS